MAEHIERREDQKELLKAMKAQNILLADQNITLAKICAIIDPVSKFFEALKTFVIFVAWIAGVVAAVLAIWHGFVAWIIASARGH